MATYFIWKDDYKLGFKEIDEQHEYFVSLLNKLYGAIMDFQSQKNLGIILDELAVYAVNHFETEEKYFKDFKFAGAEEHIHEHLMLKEKVLDFKEKFTQDKTKISFELIDFLESWLVDHLDNMDKKYIECFRENGLK
jgi:hemerythrin-like metal-binding protein